MSRTQFEALLLKRPNTVGLLFGAVTTATFILLAAILHAVPMLMDWSAAEPFVGTALAPIFLGAYLAAVIAAMLTPWRILSPGAAKTLLRTSSLHQSSAWGFRIGFLIGSTISSFALQPLTSSFPNSSA